MHELEQSAAVRVNEGHTLSTEEFARDVEGFASYNDDLLAFEELLRDCAGKTTEQVSLAVNNDLMRKLRVSLQFFHPFNILRGAVVQRLTVGSKVDILLPSHLQRVGKVGFANWARVWLLIQFVKGLRLSAMNCCRCAFRRCGLPRLTSWRPTRKIQDHVD